MKISKLQILNFRLFQGLNLMHLSSKVNVLIGANGAGKTTLLDAIALSMSHIEGNLTSDKDSYEIQDSLKKKDIKIGTTETVIEGFYTGFRENNLTIRINKALNQNGTSYNLEPKDYFKTITQKLISNTIDSLPIMVYYRINRNLFEANSNSGRNYFNPILNGYSNALTLKRSPYIDFENWFINRENLENEIKVSTNNISYEDSMLSRIRFVIATLFSDLKKDHYTGLAGRRMSNNPTRKSSNIESGLVLLTKTEEIAINSLSSGEQNLILLFSDITKRLCLLNNGSENSLEGSGIVLIDEIELHLHPKWQRFIISNLSKIFPNIQFIITTHSPQIISGINNDQLFILKDGEVLKSTSSIQGRDSNGILEEIFQTPKRPQDITDLINKVYKAIDNENKEEVNSALRELKSMTEDEDPILVRIGNLIRRLELVD